MSGSLTYYFEVVGPSAYVPIDIDFHLHQQDTLSSVPAEANITSVAGSGGGFDFKAICSASDPCADHSNDFVGTLHLSPISGFSNSVELDMDIGVAYSIDNPIANSGFAYADPFIYIDPSFADAADYSIILSPGVSNAVPTLTPPVPEPETWALMLAGFGLVGTLGRRLRPRH